MSEMQGPQVPPNYNFEMLSSDKWVKNMQTLFRLYFKYIR
jgi:hypothetical protein